MILQLDYKIPSFQGSFVNCPDAASTVMAGVCCQNDQVNLNGVCAAQCPVSQVMNENQVCEHCPSDKIANAAGVKCLSDCATDNEITNLAGNACLTSCASGGETPDLDGDNQCDGVIPDCSAIGYILSAAGTFCLPNCAFGGECSRKCMFNKLC